MARDDRVVVARMSQVTIGVAVASTWAAISTCRFVAECVFEMAEVVVRGLVRWLGVEVGSGCLLVDWRLWAVKSSVAMGIPDLGKTWPWWFLGLGGNHC